MSGQTAMLLWIGPPLLTIVLANLFLGTKPAPRTVLNVMLAISLVEAIIWIACFLMFREPLHGAIVVQWLLMGGFAAWSLRRTPAAKD